MSTAKIKQLEAQIAELKNKERGTAKALKNVQDIQAGIGKSAIPFQKFGAYFMGTILTIIGIGYIIYAATNSKDKHIKETEYIAGGTLVFMGLILIFIFTIYARFVLSSKDAQIFNAFIIESSMLRGGR